MSDFYMDNWGEQARRDNPKDWSRWRLWPKWAEKYDWRDGEDFAEQDVIVWREPVLVNRHARAPQKRPEWVKAGERLVIAHVRQYGDSPPDWVYLVVIYSEGDAPLLRDDKIRRRASNILRNGVRRWPRTGRAAIDCGEAASRRPPDPALNDPTARRPPQTPLRSRFLGPPDKPRP